MVVTVLGMETLVRPVQPQNALPLMTVTELGMVSEPLKPLHPEKALLPMVVTELGMREIPLQSKIRLFWGE